MNPSATLWTTSKSIMLTIKTGRKYEYWLKQLRKTSNWRTRPSRQPRSRCSSISNRKKSSTESSLVMASILPRCWISQPSSRTISSCWLGYRTWTSIRTLLTRIASSNWQQTPRCCFPTCILGFTHRNPILHRLRAKTVIVARQVAKSVLGARKQLSNTNANASSVPSAFVPTTKTTSTTSWGTRIGIATTALDTAFAQDARDKISQHSWRHIWSL